MLYVLDWLKSPSERSAHTQECNSFSQHCSQRLLHSEKNESLAALTTWMLNFSQSGCVPWSRFTDQQQYNQCNCNEAEDIDFMSCMRGYLFIVMCKQDYQLLVEGSYTG